MVAKSFFFKEEFSVFLWELAYVLGNLGIKKLNIFYISDREGVTETKLFDNKCRLLYINIPRKEFFNFLVAEGYNNFCKYNLDSLYILENGDFTEIKRMITNVEGLNVDIVRGSCQKSHILSPLEIRLTFYISAMFNCDYNKITYINSFNILDKKRYLPGISRRNKG